VKLPQDLIERLPHREPFRFVTEMQELSPGVAGAAMWKVTGSEEFFRGHFPGRPLVPGVLLIEALAQLSGLVAVGGTETPHAGRLAHADVRFDASITPPAGISLKSSLARTFGRLSQFDVEAWCGERRAARGTLTIAMDPAPNEGAP
jgi:3-hydroxyacyl-[acyl-carrier-protein] dehydratase